MNITAQRYVILPTMSNKIEAVAEVSEMVAHFFAYAFFIA